MLNGPDALGGESGTYTFIRPDGAAEWGVLSKRVCARRILDAMAG